MEKKLEILVIEDDEKHQLMAREQLGIHNLTLVSTFDEAGDLISGGPYGETTKRKFDAVLTDMFLTQGRGDCMSDKKLANQELPFGYALALIACKEETPYVAILSDANHHANPIAYTMDFFRWVPIKVGNSRLAILKTDDFPLYRAKNGRLFEYSYSKKNSPQDELDKEAEGTERLHGVKNWAGVLKYIMSEKSSPEEEGGI